MIRQDSSGFGHCGIPTREIEVERLQEFGRVALGKEREIGKSTLRRAELKSAAAEIERLD